MSGVDIRRVFGTRLLLADGSTGTALEALAPGRSAVFLPLEDPALVYDLHRAYFDAGSDIVETATFGADERGLGRLGASGRARALNRAACEAAVRAARRAETDDGRPRWVAGSVGPGEDPPSLTAASYEELRVSYLPQMLGLLEGGADLVILETCQDPLQIKAGLGALYDAQAELERSVPVLVSATVDASGRMLTGTGMEALAAIVAPFRPLALGLNCSGGPAELAAPLDALAEVSPLPLSVMPNAGLPVLRGTRVSYPLGPEDFARATADLVRRTGAALAGGCCGTGPEHIRALAALLADRPKPLPRPARRPALASLYEASGAGAAGSAGETAEGPELLRIGEKANAAGSAVFSRLVSAGDVEGQAAFALAQEASGVQALDLHLARPGRDEAADLSALVSRLAVGAQSALSLDSAEPEVLAAALPLVGGRPLLNSVNLEDEERARRLFRLARRYGAAVVCLALDGRGPARTAADKALVCGKLYGLALAEGLEPEDLYFDCLTFSLASESRGFEGSAAQTLKALALVKRICPGASTILGVGNVSFGLPRPLRPPVTALFLEAARRAGLDAAILDPGLPAPASVQADLRAAVGVLLGGADDAEKRAAALDSILALDPGRDKAAGKEEPAPPAAWADPAEGLKAAILRGEARAAAEAARALVSGSADGPERLTALVARAMSTVGERYASGDLALPRVLRGAQAAESALTVLTGLARRGEGERGTVVLATVRGDLHDIGKNLTGLILAGSGYRVVDLGVDVGTELLMETVRREKPAALGLSGLLARSLGEMRRAAEALRDAGLPCLLLLGGAAVDRAFVETHLGPLLPGRILACADAFEALRALAGDAPPSGVSVSERAADGRSSVRPSRARTRVRSPDGEAPGAAAPSWTPPFLGARLAGAMDFESLLGVLDTPTLFRVRWAYGGGADGEAKEGFERLTSLVRGRGLCRVAGVYGYFPCEHLGGGRLRVENPRGGAAVFTFPIEAGGAGRCVARYFDGPAAVLPLFAVTVGAEFSLAGAELRKAGAHEEYFRLHGLAASLAEAAAELEHRRIGEELVAAGAASAGRRYSFGFPACPGVESQGDLLALLGAERIGLSATEGHQLKPEFSVTAFVVPRPDAEYFRA